MKIDPDELDRKARAATPGPWLSEASEAEDGEVWSAEPYKLVAKTGRDPVEANARHIAANSPDVTLALTERIRRLEGKLTDTADALQVAGRWPNTVADIRELLAKGVTL